MSGNVNGWPYVTPDDKPKEYPAHSQQLATKLDSAVKGPVASGFASLGGAGGVAAGSQYTVPITFPAGRFTALPTVTATVRSWGSPVASGYLGVADAISKMVCTVSGETTTGCSITVFFPTAYTLTASQQVFWIAIGRA